MNLDTIVYDLLFRVENELEHQLETGALEPAIWALRFLVVEPSHGESNG